MWDPKKKLVKKPKPLTCVQCGSDNITAQIITGEEWKTTPKGDVPVDTSYTEYTCMNCFNQWRI